MAEHRKDMIVFGGQTATRRDPTATAPATSPARAVPVSPALSRRRPPGRTSRPASADQLAAQQLGDRTRLPSLELAIEKYRGAGNCDSGYSCVYEHTLSWRDPTTPIPPEVNPKQVFDRLFADRADDPAVAARNGLRASVLDSVLEDARDLNRKLGGRTEADQYLSGCIAADHRPVGRCRLPDYGPRPPRPG